jgi:hypothetical protein
MTSKRIQRETLRDFSLEAAGRNPRNPRVVRRQILLDGAEREIHALPFDAASYARIQDMATGAFTFMVGMDGLDEAPLG